MDINQYNYNDMERDLKMKEKADAYLLLISGHAANNYHRI